VKHVPFPDFLLEFPQRGPDLGGRVGNLSDEEVFAVKAKGIFGNINSDVDGLWYLSCMLFLVCVLDYGTINCSG